MSKAVKAAEEIALAASPNSVLRVCVLILAIALTACSSQNTPENKDASAEPALPAPEYAQRDGDQYMYVGELTDEQRAQGKQATVVSYRYLGASGNVHKLEMLSDQGFRIALVECAYPCRVAKQTDSLGVVTRVAVQPMTIAAAAFRDAAMGNLTLATKSPLPSAGEPFRPTVNEGPAPFQPQKAVGAQADYRGKVGRCRLTVDGKPYINGSCWVRLESDGSFQIMSQDESYFAQLSRSGSEANGFWNGAAGAGHAQLELGSLSRAGACWKNASAEICAWS